MRKLAIYCLLICSLFLVIFSSLIFGAMHIPIKEVLSILSKYLGLHDANVNNTYEGVIYIIRLPRLLLGLLVGAALGVSGAAIQGIFRNPLAEPGLIGISAGASLMAVIVISLELSLLASLSNLLGYYLLAFGAFVGAGVVAFLVYNIARTDGRANVATMLLAGIAINAFAGALTGLITYLADEQQLRTITFWMLGSLGGATWQTVWSVMPFIALPLIVLPLLGKSLNAFSLGETQASILGLRPNRVKTQVVVLATLAVGASVAVSGIIGFVGLLVPHIVRLAGGVDHRFVLPASALFGALTLTLADVLARNLAAPIELPIGVITALLGSPVFLYILIKEKKKLFN
ncbi:FecCD family ABC transporter permease [Olivibacter domesticus]|uniref:Iron complex transport system permease protein n=1 Tax=Olivibacter domesticus TaxID=407022 RepID=A0A1H7W4K1_OLID1|nr:iron ABC transporter permease [Olivibacter domesticus]SEM16453.1 iron complex transport system permease protein [Olivibacter domesticus]